MATHPPGKHAKQAASAALLALSFLPAAAGAAMADAACHDRFVALLTEGNGDVPVTIRVTQEIKDGPVTETVLRQAAPGHTVTETVSPAGQPWLLIWDGRMFTSADEGKSWSLLRDLDPSGDSSAADAPTVTDAVCGEEALDGVVYDTVEADYTAHQGMEIDNHARYWVDRETGFIVRTTYLMKTASFESLTTQVIEATPDLVLPTPE